MLFTRNEIRDLLISVLALTLVFSNLTDYLFAGMLDVSFIAYLMVSTFFIVVIAFFSHEMSHKFVAMHYGCDAEYRMWPFGLLLGIVLAILPLGFVIAAPGAVYISPYKKDRFAFRVANLTRKSYAIISLSGPLTNIALASALLAANFAIPSVLLVLTARISFFLAFFNLLPIPPMDGSKVMRWDIRIWGILMLISIVGSFFI